MMMEIVAEFAGRRVQRREVLAWENKRIDRAARKLGIAAPSGGDVTARREAFLAAKLDLGVDVIVRRLARDTRWADRVARLSAKPSARRRVSTIDLHVGGGNAGDFVAWFEDAANTPDEAAMLRACPDHFVVRNGGPTGHQVLETTGSSPLALLIALDYDDLSTLTTPVDPAFSDQLAVVARASDGTAVGGTRHLFRDTATGYQARLAVEFPMLTPPTMISGHRWHLACEFSNWAEMALA